MQAAMPARDCARLLHVGPPATDGYGFMKMVRCERYSSRMTTRLAKLSGLGLASWPAYNSLRREAAAQAFLQQHVCSCCCGGLVALL